MNSDIVVKRQNGTTLRGKMWTRKGAVTVRSSDLPQPIARLMLIELNAYKGAKR